jgi:tyrosyl-tRNA synthetase
MLVGLDGRKMSKTYQNTVNITDPPNEMYGKLMSLRDELIIDYFKLCTDLSLKDILEMEKELKRKKFNPKEAKKKLAKEIVKIYHGEKAAKDAEEEFKKVFEEKKLPTKIPEIKIAEKRINILDLLTRTKMTPSKSEAKRLILQKAVEVDGVLKEDWREILEIKREMVIKVGKRKFLKIIPH